MAAERVGRPPARRRGVSGRNQAADRLVTLRKRGHKPKGDIAWRNKRVKEGVSPSRQTKLIRINAPRNYWSTVFWRIDPFVIKRTFRRR